MGDLLFIRVSAQTYDEAQVPKTWPALYHLAYADKGIKSAKQDSGSVFFQPHGVLELITTLADQFAFGDLDAAVHSCMEPFMAELTAAVKSLEATLAERNAQAAHTMTNTIETLLSDMEKAVQEVAPAR